MTPVYAWSDQENRKVCIGVSEWDGREGFSSTSLVQRENPVSKQGFTRTDLPSQKEMAVPNASDAYQQARQKCLCGKLKGRGRDRCHRCQQQHRRIGRRAA